ncbi:MAG: VWA domain-containing protein [Pseudohongiellaceae bacterium]
MKDLFKRNGNQLSNSNTEGKPPVASSREVQAFLGKVAALPKSTGSEARLIFSLDATASRQSTWDQASRLQKEMFVSTQLLGGLSVQLCYFHGLASFHCTDWHTDPDRLLVHMSGIHCEAGLTQIGRLLKHVIDENRRLKVKALIFIGDAMEENIDVLCHLAGQLGLLNVPMFIFQEQSEPVARQTFQEMARLSGGAFCQFDASSAEQLKDLLRAVAIYATGGLKALESFSKVSHKSVKLLGQQLK